MKRIVLTSLFIAMLFTGCTQHRVEAPVAKVVPHEFHEFGHTRVDNYFWMRLSDEQKSAKVSDAQTKDVLDYLQAENAYLEVEMANAKQLREELFDELKGRMKQDDESVPYLNNGYWRWTKYEQGKEYPLFFRRADKEGAKDELLLDVNQLAVGKSYCSVGAMSISPDNRILAYATDFVSRRFYTIRFLDLTTGLLLNDTIANSSGSMAWANDNQTLFYVGKDMQTLRSNRVFRHKLGTDTKEDALCFDEKNETFSLGIGKTTSRKFIEISSYQTLSSETLLLDADHPEGSFTVFCPRSSNHLYSVDHINGAFYILSNRDALNFKLMKADEKATDEKRWKAVIPHRSDVLLERFVLFNDYLAVNERTNGLNQLRVIRFSDGAEAFVPFAEEVYTASFAENASPELNELRYNYSSLTTPNSVCTYHMQTKETKVLKESVVLGNFDKQNYESKRLWATAGDGTKVPVSLVYKKGYTCDGHGKLLLYGYGSYGSSSDPYFNPSVISLLDRGFAYAIAHIRGGSELGRAWYEDGKLLKKKNTFTDFNDCARYLINEKYTSPATLFASGASAGGLLIGAVVNMEPELYKGVIAGVPFVDVISTMEDASIPLTTFEWDEWGNPAEEVYYDYMLSYSPYDQVKAQHYPHMLVTTGYWDSQVQYWEPAKWVAKLRTMKTDHNKLYMNCNMEAGHGGASGRFERLKSTALQYAFLLTIE